MFKDKETSYIIEFLNTMDRYHEDGLYSDYCNEAYNELKKRQPKIAKLYEYKMTFDNRGEHIEKQCNNNS